MSRRPAPKAVAAATVLAVATYAALSLPTQFTPPAQAATGYTSVADYCLDQCDDILPPGNNGNATVDDLVHHRLWGSRPAHSADQLGPYADLVSGYTGLTDDQIKRFFASASLGVPAGEVERVDEPRSDVKIVRDKATGAPHVIGTTREGTMFGAGWAGAADRLFVMDLLRHVGRGTLTSFAGGAPSNRALEQGVWRNSPYNEADLQAQVDALRTKGTRGEQTYQDAQNFIAGVNAYITKCKADWNCPGEYVAAGHTDPFTNQGGPEPFHATDIIAIGGVVGGIFGRGGGTEVQSALVRLTARAKFGAAEGDKVWTAFRHQNDPEAVQTLHNGQSFPYGQASPDAASVAMPDGQVTLEPIVYDQTGSATPAATTNTKSNVTGSLSGLHGGSGKGMSNAVVVSGAHTTDGHPVAAFGPQTAYFSPQILMLEELQGPGISARGVSFPGLNLYVQMGRGPGYAWSPTAAEQDIIDTFSVPLCNANGSTPTVNSDHYLFRGQCVAMERLERLNSWEPTIADSTPAGSYRLVSLRTKYGLVTFRGTVGGAPVAFTQLRSTYRHEAESAIGFAMYNDPELMKTAAGFKEATSNIGYTFNWFYLNSTDTAYYNSGLNPLRADGANPNLPQRTSYEWKNWNPDTNTSDYMGFAAHPNDTNQDYYVSWNNKQAPDFSAADGNFSFGSVHRVDPLDTATKTAIANGKKVDRAAVTRIVQDAAITDLRGRRVLDELIRVLNSSPITDTALAAVVDKLKAWQQSGAYRRETTQGSKQYAHAEAIRIFDAWWPLLVSAQFKSALGDGLYLALANTLPINESPSFLQHGEGVQTAGQPHGGAAFQFGWWGFVDKDLRAVLGDTVAGPLPRKFCGAGNLAACRTSLLNSLKLANDKSANDIYPGDTYCAAGDQWCADAIVQLPLGGIGHNVISWQNRPTYQMVMSFPAKPGDNVSNLAKGKSVKVSSTESGQSNASAVDGDRSTRWASNASDNQWYQVDLGATKTIRRVILRWEAAYGKAYRIEVSTDGSTWRSVWSTEVGNGGIDNIAFAATSARYVRMAGVRRGTGWGYSFWEFEVYGH